MLQDLHGGAAGVRAAGVRPHRRLHRLLQAAGRVPHLQAVRGARRALLPILIPDAAPGDVVFQQADADQQATGPVGAILFDRC